MTKMHKNEFEINENIVRALIKSQRADWAGLPLNPVQSSGTDNALFRHYKKSNPVLATLARRMIENMSSDSGGE